MSSETLIGGALNKMQESGCSLFFLTSSVLSIVTSKKNRNNSLENAREDERFQSELIRQKELYDDYKEAEERAFKLWIKERQREFVRIETAERLDNELLRADLQMFFKDWPLAISIEAINNKRKECCDFSPMNIVIGKHSIGAQNDPFTIMYPHLVDAIEVNLKDLKLIDIDKHKTKVNLYRFRVENTVVGGPALANIYSMMSTLPSIVIQPKIDNKRNKFIFSIACWNQDSFFPLQKNAFGIDYDTSLIDLDRNYLELKKKEVLYSYLTIALVLNDTYSLVEYGTEPVFPDFAKDADLKNNFPLLLQFATKEYKALLDTSKTIIEKDSMNSIAPSDFLGEATNKHIQNILNNVINSLK